MKSLFVYASLAILVVGLPQRGGQCQCRDVICPNAGRESCECMNRAAADCYKTWRNPSCSSPTPMNCNGPLPRPPNGPYQTGSVGSNGITTFNFPNPSTGRPTAPMQAVTTYYTVVPYRTTITTTLPGFGWPNPVTSYSYSMSTTTITLVKTPGGGPGEPHNPNTGFPSNPRATVTVSKHTQPPPKNSLTPPWSVPRPPPSDFTLAPTTPRPPPPPITTQPPPPPPPKSTAPRPDPWTPPANTGPAWTPIATPTIPLEGPAEPTPAPAPDPAPAPAPPESPATPGPGGLVQCGPGKPRCRGNTYCDPQPLCSIGEDCDGVCLPIVQIRQVGLAHAMYSQPWDKRREVWQKLLDEGYFVMYRYSI